MMASLKKKEDAMFAELEKLKKETDQLLETSPEKAKMKASYDELLKNAVDVEKLIRKE